MDQNPAYGFSHQNPQAESTTDCDETAYELIDIGSRDTKNVNTGRNESRESTEREKTTSKTVSQSNVVVGIVTATAVIAFILALTAIIFTVFSPMDTSNNNQEIQSLKQEIQTLKEVLNMTEPAQISSIVNLLVSNLLNQSQTEQNYEIANLREMLNQTGDNSNQEIQSLQLEIANLRAKLNWSDSELDNVRETLNQSEMKQNQIKMEHNSELANLREMLNQSRTEQNTDIGNLSQLLQQSENKLSTVHQEVHDLQNLVEMTRVYPIGSLENPASSCCNIPLCSPSGEYWIQTSTTNSPVQVYCDMTRTCCSTTGGWTRVANLDMTDPSQQCPDGFRLVNRTTAPLRTCGRPETAGCVSTTYPVHGIEYSQVCGRIRGYQDSTPDAFYPYYSNRGLTVDDFYVEGVSLTHGQSPKQHIWTFAAAVDEISTNYFVCPCTRPDLPYTGVVPPFIGQDYFCETGVRDVIRRSVLYADDPLWDGQGCGGTSTCCSFNNPPWFCKQLPQPTTDDIELRLCGNLDDEDTPLEIVDIYIN